jgi:hypothetical protein
VPSEQFGPLPDIVPMLPPGLETIKMHELVPQADKPSERNSIARRTFGEAAIVRREVHALRMERPRCRDYASGNAGSQAARPSRPEVVTCHSKARTQSLIGNANGRSGNR